jgi:hypothetical protein
MRKTISGSADGQTGMRKRHGCRLCVAGIVLTLVLLFPLRTRVVPAWTVRVVDSTGAPVVRAVVRQSWKHDPFDPERHEGSGPTDENGTKSFPRRTLRMSLAERAAGLATGLIENDPHADWGRTALIVATAPGLHAEAVTFYPGEPLPTQIRLWRLSDTVEGTRP